MRPALVTCGATRNPIDAMRALTANSTGTTGIAIARALAAAGHPTTLLGSPEALLRLGPAAPPLQAAPFGSTRDLEAQMHAWVQAHPAGLVVHAAAVGDYELDGDPTGKIPSGQAQLTLTLRPTPKILDQLLAWSPALTVVSFKAAPPDTAPHALAAIADAQRRRTGSTLVFANALGALDTTATLVDATGATHFPHRADALQALIGRLQALAA